MLEEWLACTILLSHIEGGLHHSWTFSSPSSFCKKKALTSMNTFLIGERKSRTRTGSLAWRLGLHCIGCWQSFDSTEMAEALRIIEAGFRSLSFADIFCGTGKAIPFKNLSMPSCILGCFQGSIFERIELRAPFFLFTKDAIRVDTCQILWMRQEQLLPRESRSVGTHYPPIIESSWNMYRASYRLI